MRCRIDRNNASQEQNSGPKELAILPFRLLRKQEKSNNGFKK